MPAELLTRPTTKETSESKEPPTPIEIFSINRYHGEFWLPETAIISLQNKVTGIRQNPGNLVDPNKLEELQGKFSMKDIMRNLPQGLTEDTFIEILKLAVLTECKTTDYSNVFRMGSKKFDAPWLGGDNGFIPVWERDELGHTKPFEILLLSAGYSEKQLRREVAEAREKTYDHATNITPIGLTTYGMTQELLTDHYYGLISNVVRRISLPAAAVVGLVKGREALHTLWYRDLTALQVEGNPDLTHFAAEAVGNFGLPGNSFIPELQGKAGKFLKAMGANFEGLLKDMVLRLYQAVGNNEKLLGKLLVEAGTINKDKKNPLLERVKDFCDSMNESGYGIIGQGILDRAGLSSLWKSKQTPIEKAVKHLQSPIRNRVKASLRNFTINPQGA